MRIILRIEDIASQSHLESQVGSRLGERGVRFTQGRQAVVRELAGSDGPISAAEILARLGGTVPLSSIYRSLAVLEEAGVLTTHNGTKGLTRYELAEWLAGHHHHLLCIGCGAVDDIRLSEKEEATLESLVGGITSSADFGAMGHSLEIDGKCARCA